jgi:hypothetical protein
VGLLLGVKDDVVEDKVVVLDGPGLRFLADLIALVKAADELIKVDDCPAVEESVNADD